MPVINAVYVAGESQLPQARPASAVSPAYLGGESGLLPILAYAGSGGSSDATAAVSKWIVPDATASVGGAVDSNFIFSRW